MKTFISRIAEIINESSLPEHDICVVFPNRRAGLFLRRQLVPLDGKPRWVPQMMSVEDFVFSVSRLKEPDSTSLLASLYKAHCTVTGNSLSFDSFLSFGSEILRDFEEVDQYLADAGNLFDYVRQARELDIWKPGETQTEFEKNYISFYDSLYHQYEELKSNLLEKKCAWQGLATRLMAEDTESYLSNIPWKLIIFAGFNALTPAQLAVIRYLTDRGKAQLVFDADEYYLDDPLAEAGYFLRKYRNDQSLGEFREVFSDFLRKDRMIYTCGIPGKTGQARIAGSILSQIPPEKHHATALVLADESMLLPVLNSLPDHLSKFNVTMGFPLYQAPLYALADSIFRLHVNAMPAGSAKPSFYHGDVTAVLQNTYLYRIVNREAANSIINTIKKNNYSYISLHEILSISNDPENEVLATLFSGCSGTLSLLDTLLDVLSLLKNQMEAEDEGYQDDYLSEILYSLYTSVSSLRECLHREDIHIESLLTLYNFFRESVAGTKVPFYGEPLQGIQIMGMLETRVLDFENIILISANEDILPSAKTNRSFIPFDIRIHYGLPTHHERQAVFAYHFYHLLQRCENAWLIYNEDGDTLGGGEKSRYLSQLEWELPLKGLRVTPLMPVESMSAPVVPSIVIPKDKAIMEKLMEKAGKGFSFSSFRQYINCSLSFYYSYILKLEETEEVEEEISARSMGTVLHEVLEDIYKPFINHVPEEKALKDALAIAEVLVKGKTAKLFPALKTDSGRNLLFIKVAETWLKRFLSDEIKAIKTGKAPVIKGIEEELKKPVSITLPDNSLLDVVLYGKMDRIDASDGILRVIDYKTGLVEDSNVVLNDAADLFNPDKKTDKQLQLSLYKYLTEGNDIANGYEISPGIISFRSLGKGFMPLKSKAADGEFETGLKELLTQLFNPEIPFTQTNPKHCEYCNYKQVCQRN